MNTTPTKAVKGLPLAVITLLVTLLPAQGFSKPVAQQEPANSVNQNQQTLLFANSDFETGGLTNWIATGEAFSYQPTLGDNPTARRRNQPSQHQGKYWIGTFERYQGLEGQKPGNIQGDRPTGILTSIPFTIQGETISFLAGGGKWRDTVCIALMIDGQEVIRTTGNNNESMVQHTWAVKPYLGKTARIVISDSASGGWGHINADNFRYTRIIR